MEEDTVVGLPRPGGTVEEDPLLAVLREGARQMLTYAIEAEVAAFLAVHALAAGILAAGLTVSGFTPESVECIAPANPGGGWDFTCRQIGRLLGEQQLVPGNMQVTNMAGGVGAAAYSHVMSRRADDPNVIVATSTVGVTQIAQNRYPADIDAIRWLAMLGADVGVILVKPDGPYQSLQALLDAVKADPEAVVFGGSSGAGGWDHLRLLLLAQAAGVSSEDLGKIRWVQYEGGTDAVTQMLGGFIDVVSTDLGEIAGFVEAGQIEALTVMSDEPVPGKFEFDPDRQEPGLRRLGLQLAGLLHRRRGVRRGLRLLGRHAGEGL